MLSAIHGGDKFTNFPEAPSATENRGTEAPYGTSQHSTIVEKVGEKDGGLGACPQKRFSELRPLEHQNTPCGWYESCYHH